MQKQVGGYTGTWQPPSSNQQAAGSVHWGQGHVLVPCFPQPKTSSSFYFSSPKLLTVVVLTSRPTVLLPSHPQASFMTWWAFLQPWLRAWLWFLNTRRALLVSLFHSCQTLSFLAKLCPSPTQSTASISPWLPFLQFSFLWSTEMITSYLSLVMSTFFSLSFCP